MRLWSLHPSMLDAKGLLALWREALLAQNVLFGNTKGYVNHPQLLRFKESGNPSAAIAAYLVAVQEEAQVRGYNFNRDKIRETPTSAKIPVTSGQMEFEFGHLKNKLKIRYPNKLLFLEEIPLSPHPLFVVVAGDVEKWEKI